MYNRCLLFVVTCVILSKSVLSQPTVNPNINTVNSPNFEPSANADAAANVVVDKQTNVEASNTQGEPAVNTNLDTTEPRAAAQVSNNVADTVVETASAVAQPPERSGPKRKRRPKRRRMQRKRQRNPKRKTRKRPVSNNIPLSNEASTSIDTPVAAALRETTRVEKAKKTGRKINFDFFATDDVTEPPTTTTLGTPPGFDPNAAPVEKVLPTVDPDKALAHDGTPCSSTYKSHPTIPTQYMMKSESTWITLDCPPNLSTGLIWRQDLCSCGEELVAQDPNDWCGQLGYNSHPDNRHTYMRRNHGVNAIMNCSATLVWSQKMCQCMFDPDVKQVPIEHAVNFACNTILQMKFEGNLKNSAKGYNIKTVRLKGRGRLPRIRYTKTAGSVDKAAMVVSQPLEFLAFRGNDFQKHVTYSMAFKISPHHKDRTKHMIILTDECKRNHAGPNLSRKPSISVSFQPSTQSFRLQFRTELVEIDTPVNGAVPDQHGWYKTLVYFQDGTVTLEVNGNKLFHQSDVSGKIPQNQCPLFIAGRGKGYDRSQDFYGYLDNISLVKDCRRQDINVKVF